MRFVRTNRSKNPEVLEAKSRLIVPGHLDPQLGTFRTDSPTTSPLAISLCVTVAVSKKWEGVTFDVSTAFLSGQPTTRKVYIRAPKEGLPAAEGQPKVAPGRLLEIVKGAYGLSEAPRLWYLRAREILEGHGWQELTCSRSTFLLREDERTIATLNLHVDDGIVLGEKEHPRYKKAIRDMNKDFHIKEWQDLRRGVGYLGGRWTLQEDGSIVLEMEKYISELPQIDPKKKPTQKEFRSVLMKLAWPVRHVLPQLAYGVSYLASQVENPTQEDAKRLHLLIKEAKFLNEQKEARIVFPAVDLERGLVITSFDASYAKEPGMKSQGGFVTFISDQRITKEPSKCCLVEFQSTKVDRVVKSTMAAESASLSRALDRQLYARLLLEAILHGEPEFTEGWRHRLKIPGIVVTDAKSLYDHLRTTGSIPAERQTLIDLLIARDLCENGVLEIRWVPTAHQLADVLTKMMKVPETMHQFLTQQKYCLVQTEVQQEREAHLKHLRQGQRERRKGRMKKLRDEKAILNEA